jgi:organic radical activating enzyme
MQIGTRELLRSWGGLLRGKTPLLSIEVTRDCPLRCPGCYAYGGGHVGGRASLRATPDYRGDELVERLLVLIEQHDPLHVSLVGGEPLLRHRELSRVLPVLNGRGIPTLVVTSGVLPIPPAWMELPRLIVVVSVDGLARDHDVRRHPATYERILQNIERRRVYLHWTIVRAQAEQPGYLEEYLSFWNQRPEVERILVSLYSPQQGEQTAEMLSVQQRADVAEALHDLSHQFPKLIAPKCAAEAFISPPANAAGCTFARISRNYASDLATAVEPCILGGTPDCAQCGCAISAVLHGIAGVRLTGPLRVGHLIRASTGVASVLTRLRRAPDPARIVSAYEPGRHSASLRPARHTHLPADDDQRLRRERSEGVTLGPPA